MVDWLADTLTDLQTWFDAQRQVLPASSPTAVLLLGPAGSGQVKLVRAVVGRLKASGVLEETTLPNVINFAEIEARRTVGSLLERLLSCSSRSSSTSPTRCVLLLNLNRLSRLLDDPANLNLEARELKQVVRSVAAVLDTPGNLCIATATTELSVPIELRRGDRLAHWVDVMRPTRLERVSWLQHNLSVEDGGQTDKEGWLGKIAAVTPGWTSLDLARLRRELQVCWRGSGAFKWDYFAYRRAMDMRGRILSRAASPRLAAALNRDEMRDVTDVIAGYDAVRQQLDRLCSWPIDYGESFNRLGTDPPRGILLHGPSGCGKTTLAQSVQRRLVHANFLRIRGTDLFSRYLGDSEEMVRELFALARSLNPCVVVLDELDAIASSRDDSSTNTSAAVERRILGALLTELDGLGAGGRTQVFVLGCTNKVESIDSALLRPGRIDHMIEVKLPSDDDRRSMLNAFFKQLDLDDGEAVDVIVAETAGHSCAAVRQRCEMAVARALRERVDLNAHHFLSTCSY